MDHEQVAADTLRTLAMDAVEAAANGHPGMPMGMADIAAVVWGRHLLVDPGDPEWPDRDRFVLSNGHGSMLLYGLLHLSGFPLSLDDLRNFRQFGHPTAGHPEREPHLGIEMTTGPLGQGFGSAVGMAIAEAHLRAVLGDDLVDHRTWVFASDGDLMEGVASEAASLAGRLRLGKLVVLYDDNSITIDGSTELAFTEDVLARFEAYGWHALRVDGHDREAIHDAIETAKRDDRPSLIACRTHIAYGAPTKQDTAEAHGSPLGADEVAATKRAMGWDPDQTFVVPPEARDFFAGAMDRGGAARRQWAQRLAALDAERRGMWEAYHAPPEVQPPDLGFEVGAQVATRSASGKALNALAVLRPDLIGGSADLTPSNNTYLKDSSEFQDDPAGRNLRFGVREHAMGTALNGMAIHGGLRPYGGTFLVFSDYMRPAVRLAALMEAPSIFVYTHDSIFLGEDGPTHQPIEHLASLRAIPGMWVVRPADAGETAEAWALALAREDGPTAIVLTRQAVPVLDRSQVAGQVARGAYVVRDGSDAVVLATGSEVWVALEAAEALAGRGVSLRVVSMPCWEAFAEQDPGYREHVLGDGIPRVSVEAAATFGWERWVGAHGLIIGIDHFGASAPWQRLAEEWGFTPEAVADRIAAWLESR
ncbi:MAG: transketolase [Acidimicrobiia bacterium]